MNIAFTPGEPSGIGLDLVIINSQKSITHSKTQLITITDPDLLLSRAKLLNLKINIKENTNCKNIGDVLVYPIKVKDKVQAGTLNINNASFVLKALDTAIKLTQKGITKAMLTGPIHKGIINQAGIKFSGHTEYLAEKTNSKTTMMLANDKLRLALVTTHIPIKLVAKNITKDKLRLTINNVYNGLRKQFAIPNPQIIVCGLNPHAGENGYLGDEEINIINPVILEMQKLAINAIGANAADSAFTQDNLKISDAIITMYHDQGLPVLKALGFQKSVNITLGLPFIRTSVDHGSALELAGTGKISLGSFDTALSYTNNIIKCSATT